MKKINLMLVALVGAAALTFTSCDECKDVTCENGGTCEEGVCNCLAGYSGTNCEIEDKCVTNNVTCEHDGTCEDGVCTCTTGYEGEFCADEIRKAFIGEFNVSDEANGETYLYESSISADSDLMKIKISNAGGYGASNSIVVDVIDNKNAKATAAEDGAKRIFNGTIKVENATTIVFTYDVKYTDNSTESGVATFTKK